ncbi:hypothetical protein [Piscinibacter sp.]|uniref:hypothetical protein n=1 Tax=Piscinibacter sp. TaxID=1903157 RepID=UPI001D5ADF22|nr:hypothetical protein [Piscinibacter sp.]MBK7529564.1 hypothetical protein [Piscinibacter sp.]
MPDSNALSIQIRTAAAWRFGTAALTLAASLSLGWWFVTAFERDSPGWIWLGLPASLALGAAAAMHWIRSGQLRREGEVWRLADGAPGSAEETPGSVAVALDGGHWMLLRFRATPAGSRRHVRWLALSRRDLGGQWHALRCAVYSPRPDPAGRSAQAPAAPSA